MRRTTLGSSACSVSALCLGTMHFGTRDSYTTSKAILNEFLELGGNFIDTANIYSFWIPGCIGGESESLLGRWMRSSRKRHDLVIATKVGFAYPETPFGLRESQILAECEKSLRRLRTDYIDLYLSHGDDPNTPIEESLSAFYKLQKSGKVRLIGASNYSQARLAQAIELGLQEEFASYCSLQQRYSLLQPTIGAELEYRQVLADESLVRLCAAAHVTLLAYSPLLGGALARPLPSFPSMYLTRTNVAKFNALRKISRNLGVPQSALALAWLLNHDPPILPVTGASTPAQLRESVSALSVNLPDGFFRTLSFEGDPHDSDVASAGSADLRP